MITVVSGLPRSGTSLMMQILEANGFDILTDNIRVADESNQRGYYEYEKVKSLIKDNSWLQEAEGKTVKVIAQLIPSLPKEFEYKVIFMERNINEILASQTKMLERLGSEKQIPAEILKKVFEQQVEKTKTFLNNAPNFKVTEINFKSIFTNLDEQIMKINFDLELNLASELSGRIVKTELYREKAI